MAGYSGTPLAKKLGIAEGAGVALLGAPDGFADVLAETLPAAVAWLAAQDFSWELRVVDDGSEDGTADFVERFARVYTPIVTVAAVLVVAIPVVFFHTVANTRSKTILAVLEEQSTGLVAERAEREQR